MPIFSSACAIAVVALVAVHVAIVRLALRMFEYAPPLNADETAPDLRAEIINFPTSNAETLAAAYFHHRDRQPIGLILFCHELGADKWSAMSYCDGLWKAGFDIFALDFRNHGESDEFVGYEPIHWLTNYEVEDVQAALRFIAEQPEMAKLPLQVFGISRGGGAALVATAESPAVLSVCTDGAYTTQSMTRLYARRWLTLFVPAWMARLVPAWHIDMTIAIAWRISQFKRMCRYVHVESYLPKLRDRRTFLISGKRDTYVLPDIAMWIYDCIGGEERTLWIVPQAKHNQARSIATEQYDERLVGFFTEGLPASQPSVAELRKKFEATRTGE